MKNYKKQYISLMLVTVLLLSSSCNKDFLDEELTTAYTQDYYKTEAGIQALAIGTYSQVFAAEFATEIPLPATESGTLRRPSGRSCRWIGSPPARGGKNPAAPGLLRGGHGCR